MTYEIYRYIFIGGAALTAIFFVVSIILFFTLKIYAVIGDLSGATAKKAIANIRSQAESGQDSVVKTSPSGTGREKLTDKISMSGNLIRNRSGAFGNAMATEKISTQQLPQNTQSDETTLLYESSGINETTLLYDNSSQNETTVLSSNAGFGETSVLDSMNTGFFVLEYEITYIHTNEIINIGI